MDIAISYAARIKDSKIVLLQDAVYSAIQLGDSSPVYAIDEDILRRGLRGKVPTSVHVINYDALVQMMEKEKTINFM